MRGLAGNDSLNGKAGPTSSTAGRATTPSPAAPAPTSSTAARQRHNQRPRRPTRHDPMRSRQGHRHRRPHRPDRPRLRKSHPALTESVGNMKRPGLMQGRLTTVSALLVFSAVMAALVFAGSAWSGGFGDQVAHFGDQGVLVCGYLGRWLQGESAEHDGPFDLDRLLVRDRGARRHRDCVLALRRLPWARDDVEGSGQGHFQIDLRRDGR